MVSEEWKGLLKNFDKNQKLLDEEEMTCKDLQGWCAEMNFVIKEIIVNVKTEFDKFREMEFTTEDGEPVSILKEHKKDFGGYYT